MNRQKGRRNNKQIKVNKVIRCSMLKRPVFEHEVCKNFIIKTNTNLDKEKNCVNCKYSF